MTYPDPHQQEPNSLTPAYPPHHQQPWAPRRPQPPQWGYAQQRPPYAQQAAAVNSEKAGLFRAGKVAIWVWVALTVAPIVIIALCCFGCMAAGIIGDPGSSTPTPTP